MTAGQEQLRLAVSIHEAAKAVGISKSLMYELLADGKGPKTFTIGRSRLVLVDDLKSWAKQLVAGQPGLDPPNWVREGCLAQN